MNDYLDSTIKRFKYYKKNAEDTIAQLTDEQLFWQYNSDSNSIAIIMQHMAGNMLSRWTDFLTSDGEKEWRKRDEEFEHTITNKEQLFALWNKGWNCLFNALDNIQDADWQKTIYIRSEPHTVVDAINRQLSHYPYHVGQIVFIGKMLAGEKWKTLTVAKGASEAFNAEKFKK